MPKNNNHHDTADKKTFNTKKNHESNQTIDDISEDIILSSHTASLVQQEDTFCIAPHSNKLDSEIFAQSTQDKSSISRSESSHQNHNELAYHLQYGQSDTDHNLQTAQIREPQVDYDPNIATSNQENNDSNNAAHLNIGKSSKKTLKPKSETKQSSRLKQALRNNIKRRAKAAKAKNDHEIQ